MYNIKIFKKKFLIIIFICIIALTIYCYIENNFIKVDNYTISLDNLPSELNGLKIAHVSDVHLPKNASSINNLVKLIAKENVDLIFMTGDIIDDGKTLNTCGFNELCSKLSIIAPTYAVTGNHEFLNNNLNDYKEILTNNNIQLIDNSAVFFTRGKSSIAIMGLEAKCHYSSSYYSNIENIVEVPKLLLAHHPELFNEYFSSDNNVIPDVVFSGHAHGGQFRIPLINRGILAPGQGLFPKYTSGIYKSINGKSMIISRGLGNSSFPFRIHNRPTLPIITLTNWLISTFMIKW